jgi:hypothetical protein
MAATAFGKLKTRTTLTVSHFGVQRLEQARHGYRAPASL